MDSANVILEMPQEHKTAWLEALRSGKYQQASGYLCAFDTKYGDVQGYPDVDEEEESTPKGFCCLGVLVDIISGRRALIDGKCGMDANTVPSNDWYDSAGMTSFYKNHVGLNPTESGYLPKEGSRADSILTSMNDGYHVYRPSLPTRVVEGKSFLEIADYIEANVRGV